jgi:hypothetical protein
MDYPQLPSFFTDSYYTQGQQDLYGLGTNFLKGNIPEYYRSIGETGGPEFQDLLRLNTTDITRSGLESAAKLGTRSGAVTSNINKAVGDMTTRLRWADVVRAMQGKQDFLNTGVNAVTGVRNAGLTYGGQQNQFNLGIAGIKENRYNAEMQREMQEDLAKQQMWSEIISGGLSAAGTFAGMGFAGGFGGGSTPSGSAVSKTALSNYYDPNPSRYLNINYP